MQFSINVKWSREHTPAFYWKDPQHLYSLLLPCCLGSLLGRQLVKPRSDSDLAQTRSNIKYTLCCFYHEHMRERETTDTDAMIFQNIFCRAEQCTTYRPRVVFARFQIDGILTKGPYLPCVSMVGRALLARYHRNTVFYKHNTTRLCHGPKTYPLM